MQDGPAINVVTKFHIKNYQPQVYDEIQKIMQDRKKKIVKQFKKAKKKLLKKKNSIQAGATSGTVTDSEIDQLVHKYVQQNATKNMTTDDEDFENSDKDLEECLDEVDFSGPIEALVVNGDITKSKLL